MVPESKNQSEELVKKAPDLLSCDFSQCFAQARHYDDQIVDIFKYTFTIYTTLGGSALGLYQFSRDKGVDITGALVFVLSLSLLFGLIMLPIIIRSRVYFVICMRYVNEHRQLFLSVKPLGFLNKSKMYKNPNQPPYFNTFSSQSLMYYGMALANSVVFGIVLCILKSAVVVYLILSILLFVIQIVLSVRYLNAQEGKSASKVVFRQENENT